MPFTYLPFDQNNRYNGDGDTLSWQRENSAKQGLTMAFQLQPLATTSACYSQQQQQQQEQQQLQVAQDSINFFDNAFTYQEDVEKQWRSITDALSPSCNRLVDLKVKFYAPLGSEKDRRSVQSKNYDEMTTTCALILSTFNKKIVRNYGSVSFSPEYFLLGVIGSHEWCNPLKRGLKSKPSSALVSNATSRRAQRREKALPRKHKVIFTKLSMDGC